MRKASLKHLHLKGQPLIIGDDDPMINAYAGMVAIDNRLDISGHTPIAMKPLGKRSVSYNSSNPIGAFRNDKARSSV